MTKPRASALTQPRLKEFLKYDSETGIFTWSAFKGPRCVVGKKVGRIDAHGYRIIFFDGNPYKAHRLAWLYMTGEWPEVNVDHRNHIRSDNRWSNLRAATLNENGQNRSTHRNNTSGVKGVSWHKGHEKWGANIYYQGRLRHLGYFDDLDDATEFVQLARDMCHEEFACHA